MFSTNSLFLLLVQVISNLLDAHSIQHVLTEMVIIIWIKHATGLCSIHLCLANSLQSLLQGPHLLKSRNQVVQLPITPLYQPPHHSKLENVFNFHKKV